MKNQFDIPENMRDFAERSVDQARKAFDDFMTAAQKAAGTLDSPGSAMQEGARSMQAEAVSFAEATVTANFELAQRLLRAKTIEEMAEIQQDFLRQQMAAFADQSRRLTEIASRMAKGAGKPKSG